LVSVAIAQDDQQPTTEVHQDDQQTSTEINQEEVTTTENPIESELTGFRTELKSSFDQAKNSGHEGLQKFLEYVSQQRMAIEEQHEKFRHEVQQIDKAKTKAKEMTKYLNQLRRELIEESKDWSQAAQNKTNELWDSVRQYEKLVQQSLKKSQQSKQSQSGPNSGEQGHHNQSHNQVHQPHQPHQDQNQNPLDVQQHNQQDVNQERPEIQGHIDQREHDLDQHRARQPSPQIQDQLNQQDQQPNQEQPNQDQQSQDQNQRNLEMANVHSSSARQHADDQLNQGQVSGSFPAWTAQNHPIMV